MFLNYKPTWMIEKIYNITPEQLKNQGIKAVLTDLDNTLVAWNNPDGTKELIEWIETMKEANIPVIVVSNNKASRIERVVTQLGLDYVSRAMKPLSRGFKAIDKRYGFDHSELIMIGDQVMTDIKGANSVGIRTVLVKPIIDTDDWNTRFNRAMEKRIMTYLKKRHSDMIWRNSLDD